MSIPPNSGVTLTTPNTAHSQTLFNYIIYSNPATITSIDLDTATSYGVLGTAYGTAAIPNWTLINLSTIIGSGGVYLLNGGLVDNQADTSAIYATLANGVGIVGNPGSVANQGSISALRIGIDLALAGAITNGSTANAYAVINGNQIGAYVGGAASIINYATIQGAIAVSIADGGIINNVRTDGTFHNAVIRGDSIAGVIVTGAAATITNSRFISGATGIEGVNAPVTVNNSGRISGTNFAGIDKGPGIYLEHGGVIANQYVVSGTTTLTGNISGGPFGIDATGQPATVFNSGDIAAYYAYGTAIELSAGGLLENGGAYGVHPGTISGNAAVIIQGGVGTLENHSGAVIDGTGSFSTDFAVRTTGSVFNAGTITGGGGGVADNFATVGTTTILPDVANFGSILATYAAVSMIGAGTSSPALFANYSGGLVQGGDFGVVLTNADADITNFGAIRAIKGIGFRYPAAGIYFAQGSATIDNGAESLTSAYVFGKYQGIYVSGGDATVTNYGTIKGKTGISTYHGTHSNTVINFGTIIGTASDSVFFGKGNSRLVDEPGAVFVGNVFGNAGSNVLELASATAAGTLKGLSSSFANFATVLVDHSADWYIDGSNFVALTSSGGTIENDGTLNVRTGQLFSNFGTIDNIVGTFNVGTSASFSNFVTVKGGVTLESNATLTNNGAGGEIGNLGNAILATGTNDIVRNNATLFAYGSIGAGVLLQEGGTVINGGSFNHTAAIDGVSYGVSAAHTAVTIGSYGSIVYPGATITNYATITGTRGVQLDADGLLANGPGGDTAALIYGSNVGAHVRGGTITNDGTIGAGRYANAGIFLDKSGAIRNGEPTLTTAVITAGAQAIIANGYTGLHLYGAAFSLSNFGTILAGGLDALQLVYGVGTIVNGASDSTTALISGNQDGIFDADNQTAYPYIQLEITNFANIVGTIGVDSRGNTQLTNFGTIIGSGGTAVAFGNNDAWLVDEPGAKFVGHVTAGTGHNTLELAAGVTSGVLLSFGSYYTNFGTVTVDPGAAWDFFGNAVIASGASLTNDGTMLTGYGNDHLTISTTVRADSGKHGTISVGKGVVALYGSVDSSQLVEFSNPTGLLQLGNTGQFNANIAGFKQGETINLTNIVANQAVWSASVLTISSGGIPAAYLTLAGDFTGAQFFAAPAPAGYPGTDITTNLPCFAAGTRISTERGDIAVEDIRFGDSVYTHFAGWAEVKWIGQRRVDGRRHPHPQRVWPVRIAAHAFGRNKPCRDLFLSPDHAVFVDDVLIPVSHLINDTSVVQVPREAITYFHVELPRHDVLFADGLTVESFLDTGTRTQFENGDGPIPLFPDFASRIWEASACAPLIIAGPRLTAARRLLNETQSLRRAQGSQR